MQLNIRLEQLTVNCTANSSDLCLREVKAVFHCGCIQAEAVSQSCRCLQATQLRLHFGWHSEHCYAVAQMRLRDNNSFPAQGFCSYGAEAGDQPLGQTIVTARE
jgi:hypothetical protein